MTETARTPLLVRVRSAVLLTVLLVLLGIGAAAVLGVIVLALGAVMDRALG